MKNILVLLILASILVGCSGFRQSCPPLQVDFPRSLPQVDQNGEKYYVIKIAKDRSMLILGQVEDVYPECFIGGEGLPLE